MPTFYSISDDQNGTASNHLPIVQGNNAPNSELLVSGTMTYLSFSHSSIADALADNTQTQLNHHELPVATAIFSQGITGVNTRLLNHTYSTWKDGRNEMLFMQTIDGSIHGSDDLLHADDSPMSMTTQLSILNGQSSSLQQSNVPTVQNQGLSLSLNTQMPIPLIQCQPISSELSYIGSHQSASGNVVSFNQETFQNKHMHGSALSYGHPNLTTSIPNSKYLKAAQELVDEVVNVGKVMKKTDKSQGCHTCNPTTNKDASGSKSEGKTSNPQDAAANSSCDFSPSRKQDLQNKVILLLGMLDEVDRRYKQYDHQMLIIVSYFDSIAGGGAAKPYTSLALQTISRRFRCLRDAISDQIQVVRKSLGEPDDSSSMSGGLSRLRHIDQQLRQQRAMQQFGMMQPHACRPQRGLPDSSITILRAWLFEHFLHPYPKDSEKLMLTRQTGLSRNQVSNWFINARVRLWKPMIEDMHKEEFGDIDINSISSENPPIPKEHSQSSEDHEDLQNAAAARCQTNQISEPCPVPAIEMVGSSAPFQNESTARVANMNIRISNQRPVGEDSIFLQDALANADRRGSFFAYQMAELVQCGNSGVSLTLGLQQCDLGLPMADNHQSFLEVRGNNVYHTTAAGPETDDYDYANVGVGERQQRFGSAHLLHDFVS